MLKILVTGASGFVGGSFLKRFASNPDIQLHGVSRSPLALANYTSLDLVQGLNIDFAADVVIHAAAHVSPWGSSKEYTEKNITATQNVIGFCEKLKAKGLSKPKLIYLSSSSIFYRDQDQLDITEDSPIGPSFINEYSASKYAGEKLVKQYSGPHVILRPRAIFGPGDTVLFPRILQAAKKGRLPLLVRNKGKAMGDLIYIDSLLDYMMQAATREEVSGAINLTNAEAVDMQAMLMDVLTRLQLPLPRKKLSVNRALIMASTIEGIYRLLRLKREPPITRYGISVLAYSKTFDPARMLDTLGPPSVSIEEGIQRFIQWQKQEWQLEQNKISTSTKD